MKIKKRGGNDTRFIAIDHEYILTYAKNIDLCNLTGIIKKAEDFDLSDKWIKTRGKYILQQFDRGSLNYQASLDYPIECPDKSLIYAGHVSKAEYELRKKDKTPRNDHRWLMSKETFDKAKKNDFIVFEKTKDGKWNVRYKTYQYMNYKMENVIRQYKLRSVILQDDNEQQLTTKNGGIQFANIMGDKNLFDRPKDVNLIKFLFKHLSKNATILDFFAGSGTTGQAVMELNQEDGGNRRFILCTDKGTDKENNIAENICRERLYRVINGKGSNGQKIDWTYSKNQPYLSNNHIKYLTIKDIDKIDGQYEDINSMSALCENEFNKQISIKNYYD